MLLVVLASAATTLVGGLVASRVRDHRHLVLGLAAGLMLGVVAFDLIPESLKLAPTELANVPTPLLAGVAGFLALHVIERSAGLHRGHEHEYADHVHSHAPNVGTLGAAGMVIHSLLDGFTIGAAFQTGGSAGAIVAVAVIAHDFADGFNTFTLAAMKEGHRRRALTLLIADAAAPILGACLTLVVQIPHLALGIYLGGFAGVLLYLATADILPEAHANHPTRLTAATTIVGAAAMWAAVAVAG